jgi:hypothetical protein
MDVKLLPENRVYGLRVYGRARGVVQARMLAIGAISFQLAFAHSAEVIDCTAIAIADISDAK